MIDDSLASLTLIRISIAALQSIGPWSLAWTTWQIYHLLASHGSFSTLRLPGLQAYVAAEALFYLFFLWYRRHLQREAIHPPLRTREQRRALVAQVRTEIHDVDRFLSGWFRGADPEDIGREELKRFLDWSFWEGRATDDDAEEMDEYVRILEYMIGREFPEGKGRAKALRLTLDPIDMDVRSLTWYGVVMLVEQITFARFWAAGFAYRRTRVAGPWVFPPRPATMLAGGRSPARTLSYWHRPHTSKSRLPVLFIHGIGIGLYPYVDTLKAIADQASSGQDGDVGMLAIELLPICSRLTKPILQREDFISEITKILDKHGYDKFVLSSHSYGSVFSAYMLTHDALAARISATVLIDPVTILLHMPDVAFNFTVRQPKTANEWQLWYFASKDPGVSHTLGRHFHWRENCLWRTQIKELLRRGMRVTVSLAARDMIVDTRAVAQYLLHDEVPDPVVTANGKRPMKLETPGSDSWKVPQWHGKGLDVLWCEDLDHAQVFDDDQARARLVDVINEYTKRDTCTLD